MSDTKWEWTDEGDQVWRHDRWSIEQDGKEFILVLYDIEDSVIVLTKPSFEECNITAQVLQAVIDYDK
jgi:hypothetical protein